MKHMLIAQSGGPSAAINATVAGVVERCMTSDKVDRIYGAVNGIKGVINGNFIDLTDTLASPEQLELLCHTPAAALGSCRLKLNNADEAQLGQIVDALLSKNIGYFVYIGITAIVRLIIIDHQSPMDVLIYSAAILLLVITLWLCNSQRLRRE